MTDNSGEIALCIFDATGRMIKSMDELSSVIGDQLSARWDGTDHDNRQLPGGVYFVQLATAEHIITEKIVKLE